MQHFEKLSSSSTTTQPCLHSRIFHLYRQINYLKRMVNKTEQHNLILDLCRKIKLPLNSNLLFT